MAYDMYQSYLSNSTTLMQGYIDGLQQMIDENFDNASDVYTIQEELTRGSKVFSDVIVRITHVVNKPSISAGSNSILGDDIRNLIFSDLDHAYGLGYMYQFDDNYWLCNFSDKYHYPTASASIRRCNNTLKWIDENGKIQEEPCIIDYLVNRDKITMSDMNLLEGDIKVTCQNNINTATIVNNQRFIFDGQPFKIQRINSFLREQTMVANSAPLISFNMYKDSKVDGDDLANNIANADRINYTLTINQSNFNGVISDTGTLTATVILNGNTVTKPLIWSSSDNTIVTIDSNGNYTLLGVGTATVTCCLTDNNLISNSVNITVANTSTVNDEIRISPNITTLYEGDSPTVYTIYKYSNNIQQTDGFSFTDNGINNINNQYYIFKVLSNNSFCVQCVQRCTNDLNISCIDLVDGNNKTINIALKGGF